jgi:two-component system, sensor histidine kinase and response regulator
MNNDQQFRETLPSRIRLAWKHNLRFRVTVGLSFLLGTIMVIAAGTRLVEVKHALEQSTHARALAISRTFTIIGSAAVIENLYRIQEALGSYRDDPDILFIDIVDHDLMVIASTDATRIGQTLHESHLDQAQIDRAEVIAHVQAADETPLLIVIEPLRDQADITAWVRIEFSLASLNKEITREVHASIILTMLLIGAGILIAQLSIRRITVLFRHIADQLQATLNTLSRTRSLSAEGPYPLKQSDPFSPSDVGGELEHMVALVDRTTQLVTTQAQSLQSFTASLEQMVASRTAELSTTVEQLTVAKNAAEAASVAKSNFLANMSHEIRTPMNGVLGMTELLMATHLTDRQRRMAETVQRSGTALLGIINDILDFSKIEAGKLELERIEFGLRQTLDEAVELFAEPAGKKGVELTCFLPNEIPNAVIGDPIRLRQVLLNLLGNALKFTERGEVSVRVHCLSQEVDRVTLKYEVRDTGIGIPEEVQKRLFTAFSQADGSTTRRFGGTGLGLAIVRQLVHLMGGEVGIESVPGQGSTFWFTMQLEYNPKQHVKESALSRSLAGTRVLIVDDNATNRFVLEAQLQGWEAETLSADSASMALDLLKQAAIEDTPVDLAILDIHMRDMGGIELARVMKADPALRTIPLLALSSVEPDSSSGQSASSNFFAWLRKPARQSMLRDCLLRQRYASPEAAPITACASPAPTVSNKRVLLAEDNPVNREVALGMLEFLGCHVDMAENGQQAVEVVSRQRYDLVFMDCQMPVLDGFAATAAIRQHEASVGIGHHIPIIALTANAMEGDRDKCLAAGMDDYLSKPFSQEGLRAALQRWMVTKPLEHQPAPQVMFASKSTHHDPLSVPLIDESIWNNLLAMERSEHPGALQTILSLYLSDSRRLILEIRKAIHTGDVTRLNAEAHQLKSASAQVGALAAAHHSGEIERLAREEQLDVATNLLEPLEQSVEMACRIFEGTLRAKAA